MEAEKDKLFDHFKQAKLNQPSFDFTESVMNRVEDIVNTPLVVKPLISKKSWILILSVVILVMFGSFIIDLLNLIENMPRLFEFPKIRIKDFETSIRITAGVLALLLALTLADIVYRKRKRMV